MCLNVYKIRHIFQKCFGGMPCRKLARFQILFESVPAFFCWEYFWEFESVSVFLFVDNNRVSHPHRVCHPHYKVFSSAPMRTVAQAEKRCFRGSWNEVLFVMSLAVHVQEALVDRKFEIKLQRVGCRIWPTAFLLFFRWDIRSIFAETFWPLKHVGHLSHSCIKTRHITVLVSLYFQTFWPKWFNFFRSFQNHFGLWPKKNSFVQNTVDWKP